MKKVSILLLVVVLSFSTVLAACSAEDTASENGSQMDDKENEGQTSESQDGDNSTNEENGSENETAGDMPEYATIAGATSGGTFFLLANAFAQLLNENIAGISASAESTPGSPVILELLNNGDGELGIAQAGVADEAYHGKGQFEGNPLENISQVTYLYPNVMQMVVRKDAGVESVADLEGKTVAVGASGSATELNSKDLITAAGIDYPDGITAEYTSETQSVDLLRNRQADAANMIASLGSASMLDIMSTGDFEILPIEPEIVEKLQSEVNPAYYEFTIPANTYPNQPEPVQTFAVANWLHARTDVSEYFVYETLSILYDNLDFMIETHQVTENIKLEDALNGQTIPLHPGAIKFYEDNGIEVNQ